MDEQTIIKSVIHAATEVFGTMLALEIKPGEAFVEQNELPASEKVVALIGLAGQWIGTGMLSCSPRFACKIASIMLMAEYESVDGDVLDAMAEMSNMIYGNVKNELEAELGPMGLSIPTVIFGKNFATKSVGQQSWTVIPVKSGDDDMELKICLTPNRDFQTHARTQMRSFALQHGEA